MKFVIKRDDAEEWRWTLVANNGEPIAVSSEGYKRRSALLHAIGLVQESHDAAVLMEAINDGPPSTDDIPF